MIQLVCCLHSVSSRRFSPCYAVEFRTEKLREQCCRYGAITSVGEHRTGSVTTCAEGSNV